MNALEKPGRGPSVVNFPTSVPLQTTTTGQSICILKRGYPSMPSVRTQDGDYCCLETPGNLGNKRQPSILKSFLADG